MKKVRPAWLSRLTTEILKYEDGTGASYRQMGLKAGLGPNYISQLLNDEKWKEPLFSNVVKICHQVDVSITYIVTGAEMTRMHEEVLTLMAQLPEAQQKSFLAFLRTLSASDEPSQ